MIDTSNLLYSLEEIIIALDFNPTGEYVATIDSNGVCLVSDVTTANYRFHVELGKHGNLISKVFFLLHSDSIIKLLAISFSLTSLN